MNGRALPGRRGPALAVSALALALGLALLASDVRRWPTAIHRSDLRFQMAPASADVWEVSQRIPFGLARKLLAVDDDVAFRRAARLFRLSRPAGASSGFQEVAVKTEAGTALALVERTDADRRRKSRAANLLGILAFEEAVADQTQAATFLRRSVGKFLEAIRLDPANEEAKYNLELALRILRTSRERLVEEGGARGSGASAGAGLSAPGRGY